MQVILLERVEKLGQMGDEVKVKDGFARNFLLPKKKALRATKNNREYFQSQKTQLEARNLERKSEAQNVAANLEGKVFVLLRQAGDRGLADQDELLAVQLLAGLLGLALQLQIVGFQMRLLALEIFPVRLGGAQGLLLGQKEVAGKAVTDPDFIAHLAQLLDAFEQDHLHGRSPTSRRRAAAP